MKGQGKTKKAIIDRSEPIASPGPLGVMERVSCPAHLLPLLLLLPLLHLLLPLPSLRLLLLSLQVLLLLLLGSEGGDAARGAGGHRPPDGGRWALAGLDWRAQNQGGRGGGGGSSLHFGSLICQDIYLLHF